MNSLGSNRETVENKLILLYLINKLNIPLSNLQIIRLILENRLMNYFMLQHCLNELHESALLDMDAEDGANLYTITSSGKNNLEYLSNMIPKGIKAKIDSVFSEMRRKIRNETLVKADYTPESENKFIVNCKAGEDDFPLLELNITVGTGSDARTVCENWKKHLQEIYPEIVEILTKKRD